MRYTEHAVLKAADLAEGAMRQVEVGPVVILVARVDGKFYAVGGTCPHYGAPLAEGVLSGSRVVCPWHQSHFCLATGRMLEPPTVDDLPRYEVRVQGEDLVVRLPAAWCDRVAPAAATRSPETEAPQADGRTFLILGAGAAGFLAAQTLREAGFRGRVVLAGPERHLPYDRPGLSKNYLGAVPLDSALPLREMPFYLERRIELRRGRATAVNFAARAVTFDQGPAEAYDALLIATGGRPRKLGAAGADMKNVLLLRTLEDANALLNAARPGMRAVVVGAGFIGMEAAASLTERGLAVTVVAPDAVPLGRQLGVPIGQMFRDVHEKRGVRFRLGAKVERFEAKQGGQEVAAAVLVGGERLEADVVLAAIGIEPNTDFLRGGAAGAAGPVAGVNDDGTLNVDGRLRLLGRDGRPLEGVWAAGDVTRFPHPLTGKPVHIEHWRVAEQHGRAAAFDMAGRPNPSGRGAGGAAFGGTPYFWTFQFGVGLDYVGYADGWDEIVLDGDVAKQDFTVYYVRGGKVLAGGGCGRSRQMCALAELMRLGRTPNADAVRGGSPDFVRMLGKV